MSMSYDPSELDLDQLAAHYAAIPNFQEKRTFYSQHLYPALRDSFVMLPAADPLIEVLLLPVSNPYVPVLATARWKPRLACAIYSSRSSEHRPFIEGEIAALGLDIICIGQEVLNIEMEPERLYQVIKDVIQPYLHAARGNTHIAVDITGGTSVMSVGAAMAVSLVGGRFFYILSGTTRDDITNRAVGTEQPRLLHDPYTVFGDLEAAEAQRLYCAHDYAGASRIFTSLEQRVPGPDHQDYRAYATLAGAYAAWDSFDWKTAHTALTTLLAAPVPAELEAHRPRLQAQAHALQQLGTDNRAWESKPPLELLADLDSVFPLLGTLHANAGRREAQERYDVAALFHYRCLELMSQHRLATWGILTERPDYRPLRRRIPDLDARYHRVEESIFDNTRGLPHWKGGISLFNGYMLLAALDDPLVYDWDITQIQKRTAARNKSMLAHGFRLITQAEYQEFYDVVSAIFERFFRVMAGDRAAWEQTYQFAAPFVVGEQA